jgi:hypothetical protein
MSTLIHYLIHICYSMYTVSIRKKSTIYHIDTFSVLYVYIYVDDYAYRDIDITHK